MQGQLTGESQSLQQGCSLGFGPRERRGWALGTHEDQAASSQEQPVSTSLACLPHGCLSVITHCSRPARPPFGDLRAHESEA